MSAGHDSMGKITARHLERIAYVYIRQSSPRQVVEHKESRRRQYDLVQWAQRLGWSRERVVVIDEDQGHSGGVARSRVGFGQLISAVGSGEGGIVISLEASRLARNSPDWYNLIYLSRFTQTLIADGETVYDPAVSADRMVLGIRGQVSELELDNLIQRMVNARWSQAERGEAVWIPPTGYEYNESGALEMTSDAAVSDALETVFTKFAELGSVSHLYQYFRDTKRRFPVRRPELRGHPVVFVEPTYRMICRVLHHPVYAGAYVYGRTQTVRDIDPEEPQRVRVRRVKRYPHAVLLREHHPAYISFEQYLRNQERMQENRPMRSQEQGSERGPAREGAALLQGLAVCGVCGRPLHVSYGGRPPRVRRYHYYRCGGGRELVGENSCQTVHGKRLDEAVAGAFLEVTARAGEEAARLAAAELALEQERTERYFALQVEQAEYAAQRAARQYDAVEPENRTVARELERRWNQRLEELARVRGLAQTTLNHQRPLTEAELARAQRLGGDVRSVWEATTTTNRDRKRLLRCLIEEVQVWSEERRHLAAVIWKGGATTELEVLRARRGQAHVAEEETVALVRKLALEFNDAQIARILARRGIYNMHGKAYTRSGIVALRRTHGIPALAQPRAHDPREGPFTVEQTARELEVCPSTIHRWLREGVLRGGQVAPGAPWCIVLTEEIRQRLNAGEAPAGWVGLSEAAHRLGVPKSTAAHWVNTGKLRAVRTMVRNRSCWRIDLSSADEPRQIDLLDQMSKRRSTDAQ